MKTNRRLSITISTTFEIDLDDQFPVIDASKFSKTGEWLANDHRDGRHPYWTETFEHAAMEMCRSAVHHVIDDYARTLPFFSHERLWSNVEGIFDKLSKFVDTKMGHTSKYWRHPYLNEGPVNIRASITAPDDAGDDFEEETRG